jgi:hypothetical protein
MRLIETLDTRGNAFSCIICLSSILLVSSSFSSAKYNTVLVLDEVNQFLYLEMNELPFNVYTYSLVDHQLDNLTVTTSLNGNTRRAN